MLRRSGAAATGDSLALATSSLTAGGGVISCVLAACTGAGSFVIATFTGGALTATFSFAFISGAGSLGLLISCTFLTFGCAASGFVSAAFTAVAFGSAIGDVTGAVTEVIFSCDFSSC